MFALADYTLAADDSDTLRRVLARVWPRVLRDFAALPEVGGDEAPLQRHLRARAAHDPVAMARILWRPSIAARLALGSRDAVVGALRDVALELAVGAWLGASVALPAGSIVRSPTLGCALALSADATLDDGVLRVSADVLPLTSALSSHPQVAVRPAFVSIDGRVALALDDDHPQAATPLHPQRAGNAVDLGGRSAEQWCAALREGFALIEAHLPTHARERRMLARVVVPVGVDDERHFSCSYPSAPGAMYLSLHPDPVKMAEAAVHEFQHDKLHALRRLDPLLTNAAAGGFRSPVRPDPRPLMGVLLAAHAFLPVAAMYRAMAAADHPATRHPRYVQRQREVVAANEEAMAALRAHARPTELGAQLLTEMETLLART